MNNIISDKPHTLKVNELPSHSHRIPGYSYGEENSNYWVFESSNSGELRESYYNGRDWRRIAVFDTNTADNAKRYRTWSLGNNNLYSSETAETGNNESHSILIVNIM